MDMKEVFSEVVKKIEKDSILNELENNCELLFTDFEVNYSLYPGEIYPVRATVRYVILSTNNRELTVVEEEAITIDLGGLVNNDENRYFSSTEDKRGITYRTVETPVITCDFWDVVYEMGYRKGSFSCLQDVPW